MLSLMNLEWRKRGRTRWHVVAELVERFGLDGIGVELGVKEGRFSTHLLESFPSLRMVGVDLQSVRPPQDRLGYETYDEWNFDEILCEQSINLANVIDRFELKEMDTVEASTHFKDGSVDFVFVDAEHTYEGVKRDIQAWLPKIRSGGLICGHDYTHDTPRFAGVVRAVDELGDVSVGTDNVWWVK